MVPFENEKDSRKKIKLLEHQDPQDFLFGFSSRFSIELQKNSKGKINWRKEKKTELDFASSKKNGQEKKGQEKKSKQQEKWLLLHWCKKKMSFCLATGKKFPLGFLNAWEFQLPKAKWF
jgi:hypothetical protein